MYCVVVSFFFFQIEEKGASSSTNNDTSNAATSNISLKVKLPDNKTKVVTLATTDTVLALLQIIVSEVCTFYD